MRETAEGGREGAGEAAVGEIDGGDGGDGGGAAGDTCPAAGSGIRRVPVGQGVVGVGEGALG